MQNGNIGIAEEEIWMMTIKSLRELSLALALFFNPLLYNELFAGIMSLIGSYWATALCFYIIAGGFFATYCVLRFIEKRKNKKEEETAGVVQR